MKRLVLLLSIITVFLIGLLFARGIFSLPSESGSESALSSFFNNPFSGVIAFVLLGLLASVLYFRELIGIVRALSIRFSDRFTYREFSTEPALAGRMADTEQALNNFSAAIEKYAQHLSSHTGAIRGLSAASQELQRGAAAQNRVLMHFMENMERPQNSNRTPHWRVDPPPVKGGESPASSGASHTIQHPEIDEIEKLPIPPGCARNPRRKIEKHDIVDHTDLDEISPEPPHEPLISSGPSPEVVIDSESLQNVQKTIRQIRARQGKARLRQNLAAEALAAEEEILKAIRNLNAQLDRSEPQE
jgi:hypothetical protein